MTCTPPRHPSTTPPGAPVTTGAVTTAAATGPCIHDAARDQLLGELESACELQRSFCRRDRLGIELARLERLQQLALLRPDQWRRSTAPCRAPLALWLYGVALGVAGLGLHEAALTLLDSLPGIDGGAAGRRALLQSLLAAAAPQPVLAPTAAGGGR